MEPLYQPQGVEQRWQRLWEDEGLYAAEADDPRPTFVIAHPPPNVTGELHTGHALQLAPLPRDDPVRPRADARGDRRRPHVRAVPVRGRDGGRRDDRDRAHADDPR